MPETHRQRLIRLLLEAELEADGERMTRKTLSEWSEAKLQACADAIVKNEWRRKFN